MSVRIHPIVLLLALPSLTSLGCGNLKDDAPSEGASGDGAVGLDAGVDADAGHDGNAPSVECRGGLGEVGQGCPSMFDGAPENLPPCTRLGVQQVWTCDDVIALGLGAGAYSVDCYYGSSSHVLIGAMAVNDTNTLCGNSFTRSAAEVPTAACRFPVSMPSFYRLCGAVDSGSN
jgi:hypothetical protein